MTTVAFENSTVWIEIQDLIKNSEGTRLFDFKGVLHTEKEDIGVWDLNPIETYRDYKSNFGDSKKIHFKVGLGDYTSRIYPFRDNLEFTIRRSPIVEAGAGSKKNAKIEITRFKAIFNPRNNPAVGGSDLQTHQSHDLNVSDLVEVQLELVDRSLEPLRIKTTSGVFRNVKIETFIKSAFDYESNQVLVDGRPAVDAINIVTTDNQENVPHITIPSGLRLSALTTYLQKEIGIYNRGLGTFYQPYRGKRTWFIYPLYDTERFAGKEPRVIFYSVPQEKLPHLDRSYIEEADVLKVAVTAQRLYNDSAELNMMNNGAGVRMADARAFLKKPVVIKDGVPMADRASLNSESVIKNRKDGLDYAPRVMTPTSNPYFQRSLVNENYLGQLDLVWENADEELIYPGMPCKYVYLSQGKVKSSTGTILFVHALSSRIEKNNMQAYRTMVRVTIACQPFEHIPDIDYQGIPGELDAKF